MSEFRPLYTSHAIEKCAVSVAFNGALPEKLFSQFIRELTVELEGQDFKRQAGSQAFTFDMTSGRVVTVPDEYGPATFVSHDAVFELVVVPNSYTLTTQRYVRWATFLNAFRGLTERIQAFFDSAVSVNSLRLEYWDRFIWTGEWQDIDLQKLLRNDNVVLSPRLFSAEREAHCHTGWFEYAGTERRLFNVNVDLVAVAAPYNPTRLDPSVGIYILVQDQSDVENVKKFADVNLIERLEKLHTVSKSQMAALLQPNVAKRIGLGG
ncbi:TIGR04255 family protein [Brucella intermedia]|uniref:TIGR04255 family protein n=1 Tax=Brucella intermedia TaxID=94625 RepID=UPI0027327BAF|nr:TIGR04255 family protein [Brucella intermedia]WLF95718.1 TIGR04255 family protein [Brucella intermedia]